MAYYYKHLEIIRTNPLFGLQEHESGDYSCLTRIYAESYTKLSSQCPVVQR